jgi:parallel beta-helix repeat protein
MRKKKIIILILLVVAVVLTVGIYLWQKGKLKIGADVELSLNQKAEQEFNADNEELLLPGNEYRVGENKVALRSGTLVKLENAPDVYLVYRGTKQHISNLQVFSDLKLSWGNVLILPADSTAYLGLYQDGSGIETFDPQHLPNGLVVKFTDDNSVYSVVNGKLKHYPSATVFQTRHSWNEISTFTPENRQMPRDAVPFRYRGGNLVKEADQGAVYWVAGAKKYHIDSVAEMERWGLKWENIIIAEPGILEAKNPETNKDMYQTGQNTSQITRNFLPMYIWKNANNPMVYLFLYDKGAKNLEFINAQVFLNRFKWSEISIPQEQNCDSNSDSCVEKRVETKLSQSDEKNSLKNTLAAKRATMPLWNNGADYGAELRSRLSALSDNGGIVEIPSGRYNILSGVPFYKSNSVLRAAHLGDVIFEGPNSNVSYLLSAQNLSNITIENLVLWGNGNQYPYAMSLIGGDGLIVKSNALVNFWASIYILARVRGTSRDIQVSGNYVFDGGYVPIRIGDHGTEPDLHRCDSHGRLKNITAEDNFISVAKQGIVVACSFSGVVRRNIVRDSEISGLRMETDQNITIEDNLFHENWLDGIWLYGLTSNSTISNNVVIDNNKKNMPFSYDCWSPQRSIYDQYFRRFGEIHAYPYLDTENGQPIFTNYWCQFNGLEIEMRNQVSNNVVEKNIIGRYSKALGKNISWESPYDLRVSFFPLMYSSNKADLSKNNKFDANYFVNGNANRILDQGCSNIFTNNKIVTLNPYKLKPLGSVEQQQPLCTMDCSGTNDICRPCNNNGICEPKLGETNSTCPADCPRIQSGAKGTRRNKDVCATGLRQVEKIFPAAPGVVNTYNGDFTCEH